ncbi:uncharacterized protein BDR25DRAFT_356010 [Lindgomyces ingoldianus]|uniref:Uncharacterized protein n=1 Tax=Lindgomyces ingoldianus TaxID=673940 RepID=A0ACB6QTX9_9PLEO|nr:uncharacterized protein BDR25DRAFT_356010 [Lindgomyces ingoldianus]KAF2469752.1 hypothetical protein BDR25DRAFT_356010 [Lindgomyces ingoldianus]
MSWIPKAGGTRQPEGDITFSRSHSAISWFPGVSSQMLLAMASLILPSTQYTTTLYKTSFTRKGGPRDKNLTSSQLRWLAPNIASTSSTVCFKVDICLVRRVHHDLRELNDEESAIGTIFLDSLPGEEGFKVVHRLEPSDFGSFNSDPAQGLLSTSNLYSVLLKNCFGLKHLKLAFELNRFIGIQSRLIQKLPEEISTIISSGLKDAVGALDSLGY